MNQSRRQLGTYLLAGLLAAIVTAPLARAESSPDAIIDRAQTSFAAFLADPEMAAAREYLARARAVMIVPKMVTVGFILGGSGGHGVLHVRDKQTEIWSDAVFYAFGTGSVGLQAGVEVSEVMLLVMSERGVDSLLSTEFKLGGTASVAAGPVGVSRAADIGADMIAFSRAKGVFAGVSLAGAVVSPSEKLNNAYYGAAVTPSDVIVRGHRTVNQNPLRAAIVAATRAD